MLLRLMVHRHPLALVAHTSYLLDWMYCLPTLPLDVSCHILNSLLPLMPHHHELARHMLLLLRKQLVAPEMRARFVAVHGFCSLLHRGLLPPEDVGARSDAVLALRSACSISPSLQARRL